MRHVLRLLFGRWQHVHVPDLDGLTYPTKCVVCGGNAVTEPNTALALLSKHAKAAATASRELQTAVKRLAAATKER